MSAITQHTPGPWFIGSGNGENSIRAKNGRMKLYYDGCTTLYPICNIVSGWNTEEDNANLRLIAAAPQMLEALRTALEAMGDTYDARDAAGAEGDQLREQIAEAITAATGEATI
jgi:hypothetical protein